MIFKITFVLLLTLFGLYQSADRFSCSDGPPDGFYCTNDRRGFFNCNRDRNGRTINTKQLCPTGTRCSCFINTKCEVPESQICQSLQQPRLPKSFDVTYNLDRTEITPNGRLQKSITENVIVNRDLMKLFKRTYDRGTLKQFFLIIEKSGHHFLKFQGRYSDSCDLKIIKNFPSSFLNFDNFQLTKREGTLETYEFKIGSRNLGQSSVAKSLTLNVVGDMVTPVKYEESRIGSVNSRTSSRTVAKVVNYYPMKREPEFFRVPAFCNKNRH